MIIIIGLVESISARFLSIIYQGCGGCGLKIIGCYILHALASSFDAQNSINTEEQSGEGK